MTARVPWLGIILPLLCSAQGPAANVSVVATKTSFIWGEAVKVTATVTDAQGVAELIIGKQRNGPTGVVKLAFIREFTRFENLALGA